MCNFLRSHVDAHAPLAGRCCLAAVERVEPQPIISPLPIRSKHVHVGPTRPVLNQGMSESRSSRNMSGTVNDIRSNRCHCRSAKFTEWTGKSWLVKHRSPLIVYGNRPLVWSSCKQTSKQTSLFLKFACKLCCIKLSSLKIKVFSVLLQNLSTKSIFHRFLC